MSGLIALLGVCMCGYVGLLVLERRAARRHVEDARARRAVARAALDARRNNDEEWMR